jgi:hypothetical protein
LEICAMRLMDWNDVTVPLALDNCLATMDSMENVMPLPQSVRLKSGDSAVADTHTCSSAVRFENAACIRLAFAAWWMWAYSSSGRPVSSQMRTLDSCVGVYVSIATHASGANTNDSRFSCRDKSGTGIVNNTVYMVSQRNHGLYTKQTQRSYKPGKKRKCPGLYGILCMPSVNIKSSQKKAVREEEVHPKAFLLVHVNLVFCF